jgi:tetratricopeptide (TPR) repeat protein
MKALSSTTRSDEARATERAISCAQGALQAFESLRGSPLEKSNGVATALSRIVELGGAGRSATEVLALLVQAVELYDSVATSIENDSGERDHVMPALWNCADARLKVAEHQAENGDVHSASTSYQELLLLYERACGFCDSTRGDDLCGLLYDWGCSLTSYASFISQSLNASEDAVRVVDAAIEKLRAASQFTVGDVGPLNALGDAYQAKADILQRRPDATNAVRENLCLAITEAYDVALKTNGGDLNAMLGHAEVNMTLAAMFRKGGADVDAVRAYKTAWKAYEKALTLSEKHQPGSCEERFEVLYNSACAANRAGEQDAAQNLISLLLLCDGTTRDAIAADPDLAGL